MSFCKSDQKSMPVVGFLTCNGSGMFCRPKLGYIGALDTRLISRLQRLNSSQQLWASQISALLDLFLLFKMSNPRLAPSHYPAPSDSIHSLCIETVDIFGMFIFTTLSLMS